MQGFCGRYQGKRPVRGPFASLDVFRRLARFRMVCGPYVAQTWPRKRVRLSQWSR